MWNQGRTTSHYTPHIHKVFLGMVYQLHTQTGALDLELPQQNSTQFQLVNAMYQIPVH